MRSSNSTRSLRIAFLHPNLGIGGGERLVVDAAEELQAGGHRVSILTAGHDREHSFASTRDGRLDVRVYGDAVPMHIRGRLRAPLAIARMSWVAASGLTRNGPFDLIFCDLVAHVVPLVRLLSRAPVVFYCHFPDRELTPERTGLYRLYRMPIDRAEEVGTRMATAVLVNSRYTASVFQRAFPRVRRDPEVLYPGVEIGPERAASAPVDPNHIVAIGRFGGEKNYGLAIETLARLRQIAPECPARLTIAGGFDVRLPDSRAILARLERSARELAVESQVRFLRSPSDEERTALLASCGCLIHTAKEEHFGYVPLEAMAAGRPVVAVDRAGPAETVVDGETGYLRPPTAEAFAEALATLLRAPDLAKRMGEAGRQRATTHFSRAAFGARLRAIVGELTGGEGSLVGPSRLE